MHSRNTEAHWRLLTNHLGYEAPAPKKAIVDTGSEARIDRFRLTRIESIEGVYSPSSATFGDVSAEAAPAFAAAAEEIGRVDGWKGYYFHRLDFSALDEPGLYRVEVARAEDGAWIELGSVRIAEAGALREASLPFAIYGFRTMRSAGRFDKADRAARFHGDRPGSADLRGGWFDASGDTSKYLSHLSYANFFNPQQTPMAVWAFLEAHDRLETEAAALEDPGERDRLGFLNDYLLDEAAYGADFLMRMQDPEGYFYATVFDRWSKDLGERIVCSYATRKGIRSERYQAAFRQGGGVAIAALARASRLAMHGDFRGEDYLAAATRGFDHLEARNREYLPDGRENIIDDYCALLAATELCLATSEPRFLVAARARAASLCGRLSSGYGRSGWWRAGDDESRPFFHAAEEGLPVVALARAVAAGILQGAERDRALAAIRANLEFELALAAEVPNPFGYSRELAMPLGGSPRASFFMPHENETGYWWQGENARLASLAAAARMAAPLLAGEDSIFARLEHFATDQLDWILGLNPFDSCMIRGLGHGNAEYDDYMPNVPGCISNGVTAGFEDESDIAYAPPGQRDDPMENWRWAEQWICHGLWYVLATALPPAHARRGGAR
jgi:Glycosyl hydrolase family 9./N-terminal ig-like domain of cellulase.